MGNKKASYRFFGKNIEKKCEYCAIAENSENYPDSVICEHQGIMSKNNFCKKFQYDPLKRVPTRTPILPSFRKEEFEINS